MAQLPIMPVKVDALLADTQHMTAEEFGAYCRLLFTMWLQRGRLPDDRRELMRIAGVHPPRWSRIAETVMRPMTVAGGQISQKRLTVTWQEVIATQQRRSEAAKKVHHERHLWQHHEPALKSQVSLKSQEKFFTGNGAGHQPRNSKLNKKERSSLATESESETAPQEGSPVEGSKKASIPVSPELEATMRRKLGQ